MLAKTIDYNLLAYYITADLTPEQLAYCSERIILVVGRNAVGKSTLIRSIESKWPDRFCQLPKVMTRPPRSDEVEGSDLIYQTEAQFHELLTGCSFFIAYEFIVGDSKKLSGVLLSTLYNHLSSMVTGFIIVPAYTIPLFRAVMPTIRCIIIQASEEDRAIYLQKRGSTAINAVQNEFGVRSDVVTLDSELGRTQYFPPALTLLFANKHGVDCLSSENVYDFIKERDQRR